MLSAHLDRSEIQTLARQLDLANISLGAKRELLQNLGFLLKPAILPDIAHGLDLQWAQLLEMLRWFRRADLIVVSMVALALAGATFVFLVAFLVLEKDYMASLSVAGYVATAVLSIGTAAFALHRWSIGQISRAVDEAMKRKEISNKMIIDHANLLIPYVGSGVLATDVSVHSSTATPEDQVRISMFVYAELDNLEFVFVKSRAGLMEWDYSLRAIGIFLARAQNQYFASLSRQLVREGKYSREFSLAVAKLVAVARLDA